MPKITQKEQGKFGLYWFIPIFLVGPLLMDMYIPAISEIKQYFSASTEQVQLTLSVYMLGYGLSFLWAPFLCHYFSNFTVLLYSALLCLASILLINVVPNIYWFYVFRFLQAVGTCHCSFLAMSSLRYMVSDQAASVKAYSAIQVFAGLGPILGPTLGSLLLSVGAGWKVIFLSLSVLMFVAVCTLPKLKTAVDKSKISDLDISTEFRNAYEKPSLWKYLAYIVLATTVMFAFFSFVPIILFEDFHISHAEFSMVFTCISAFYFMGSLSAPRIVKHVGIDKIINIAVFNLFLAGIALNIFTINHIWQIIFFGAIIKLQLGLILGPSFSAMLEPFPDAAEYANAIAGFFQFVISFCIVTIAIKFHFQQLHHLGLLISICSAIVFFITRNIATHQFEKA